MPRPPACMTTASPANSLSAAPRGSNLLDQALDRAQVFRVRAGAHKPLRLLAVAGPGDLMVNTPLDFITNTIDVRLDLLYLRPVGRCRR